MRILLSTLHAIPCLSVLFTIILGSCVHVGNIPFLPTFFLIPVYYWTIFRPQDLPLWSLFGIGLFYDALLSSNLGLSSLLLMASWIGGQYIRPFLLSYSFYTLWGVFFLYSLSYTILYLLFRETNFFLFGSWIYGILLYPLVTWVLSYLHLRLRLYV